MCRCLLNDSKLDKKFWIYAMQTSAYIRNRCFVHCTGETPYFMINGRRPNLKNMHVFGTICYTYNDVKKKLCDQI